jgi:hypothetical protein
VLYILGRRIFRDLIFCTNLNLFEGCPAVSFDGLVFVNEVRLKLGDDGTVSWRL